MHDGLIHLLVGQVINLLDRVRSTSASSFTDLSVIRRLIGDFLKLAVSSLSTIGLQIIRSSDIAATKTISGQGVRMV